MKLCLNKFGVIKMEISKLIEVLNKHIPDRCPRFKLNDFEYGKMAGKLELLDLIKELETNDKLMKEL